MFRRATEMNQIQGCAPHCVRQGRRDGVLAGLENLTLGCCDVFIPIDVIWLGGGWFCLRPSPNYTNAARSQLCFDALASARVEFPFVAALLASLYRSSPPSGGIRCQPSPRHFHPNRDCIKTNVAQFVRPKSNSRIDSSDIRTHIEAPIEIATYRPVHCDQMSLFEYKHREDAADADAKRSSHANC